MKKTEMVDAIAKTTGVTKKDIEAVLKSLSDEILNVIATEDSYKLGEVGTFSGITRPAREGRNLVTGEKINIPEKHGYPKFKASKSAKTCD